MPTKVGKYLWTAIFKVGEEVPSIVDDDSDRGHDSRPEVSAALSFERYIDEDKELEANPVREREN
jgi:hypothetical protein